MKDVWTVEGKRLEVIFPRSVFGKTDTLRLHCRYEGALGVTAGRRVGTKLVLTGELARDKKKPAHVIGNGTMTYDLKAGKVTKIELEGNVLFEPLPYRVVIKASFVSLGKRKPAVK